MTDRLPHNSSSPGRPTGAARAPSSPLTSPPTSPLRLQNFGSDAPARQAISEAELNSIIAAAHSAPLSMNAEYISAVVVRDVTRRARIAKICLGQSRILTAPVFVCIVIDFAKAAVMLESADEACAIFESQAGFAAAAVDAGLVLSELMSACRKLGLGTALVDGVRLNPQAMIALLDLPPMTFPVAACCIGRFTADTAKKPRLPINTFRHDEGWQGVPAAEELAAYNTALEVHWNRSQLPGGRRE